MKSRNGFVSNSSSSSFIVAVKPRRALTKKLVAEALGLQQGTPAYDLFGGIVDRIADAKEVTAEKLMYEYGLESPEELVDQGPPGVEYLEKGWTLYTFSASDEGGDPTETFLCFEEFDIETPEIVIKGGGGY